MCPCEEALDTKKAKKRDAKPHFLRISMFPLRGHTKREGVQEGRKEQLAQRMPFLNADLHSDNSIRKDNSTHNTHTPTYPNERIMTARVRGKKRKTIPTREDLIERKNNFTPKTKKTISKTCVSNVRKPIRS